MSAKQMFCSSTANAAAVCCKTEIQCSGGECSPETLSDNCFAIKCECCHTRM